MVKKNKIKIIPIADGKQIDWFNGWPGIDKLAKAYGKTWVDVGLLMEEVWGSDVSIHHLQLCNYIYRSLKKVKAGEYKTKRMRGPATDPDLHYAIRMDLKNIKWIWTKHLKMKPTKDLYKSIRQTYQRVWKTHKKFVISLDTAKGIKTK